MADALLSITLEKLTQVLGKQISLFADATHDLEKLRVTFQSIQALLADAESRQATDESVDLWLSRLRGVAYDIDDLLDEWVISGLEEAEHDDDDDDRNKVRACLLSPCTALDHVASRYMIARRITEIRERLDEIDAEKNRFSFSSSSGGGERQLVSRRPDTGFQIEEEMMGRDEDKAEIINRLVCRSSSEDGLVHVIAIVGIGGQGKTTLAREIYHNESVLAHFNLFSWVCVTENFEAARVAKAILNEETNTHELSPLQEKLSAKLDGKRFLIVLDDVWNDDEARWNSLLASLTSGAAGSRILVTIRTRKVANTMKADIRELQGLSDDDSWRLFSSRAFTGRNDRDHSDLQAIGRQIVSNCKGVPLILEYLPKGMGRMTGLKSLSKFIVGGEGGCEINELRQLNCLQGSLEIKHLERASSREEAATAELRNKPNLRRLVLEMSSDRGEGVGSDDAETERMDSVLEGLRPHANLEELRLQCCRHNSKLPSWMADLSFSKLTRLEIRGSVIQREQNNLAGLGQLPALKHLQIENLGVKKVGRELYYGNLSNDVVGGGGREAFAKLEELVLEKMSELEEWELMSEFDADVRIMPSLSILRLENCPKLVGLPDHFANAPLTKLVIYGCHRLKWRGCSSSFSHLEEFTLDDSSEFLSNGLPHLPNLKEFRIMSIRNEALPNGGWEQLAALRQLEIHVCFELKSLPDGLTQLQSLENLEIRYCYKLPLLPEGLGQLKKLQSLRIHDLQVLTCLPDSLGQLESLERLEILDSKNLQSLPEGLGELKKLKSLKISNAEALICLPNSLAQLESLEQLHILDSKNLQSLPEGLGELKKLKSLFISNAEALICLPNSLAQLESLEQLHISGLKKLESLPEGLGRLKKLKLLKVTGVEVFCLPNSLGQLESLEELEIRCLKKFELPLEGLGQLKKLKWLTIGGDEELTRLPDSLGQLESLERFQIIGLAKLESLPHSLVQLKKLWRLEIRNMEALINLPASLGQLESLTWLTISYCGKLKSLPNTLAQLKSLEFLRIGGWKELESLPHWLGQLKSLRYLTISNCTALRSLPHCLKSLPLLQKLRIYGCPLLSERCRREGAKDWPKISRIPYIFIDGIGIY